MGNVTRLAERRWRRLRSQHAHTLEGLQRAMDAHPAGRAPVHRVTAPRNVALVPRGDDAA